MSAPEQVRLAVERLRTLQDPAEFTRADLEAVEVVLRALDERTAERDEARVTAERALQGEADARALILKETFGEGGPARALAAREASVVKLREALRGARPWLAGEPLSAYDSEYTRATRAVDEALSETPDLAALRDAIGKAARLGIDWGQGAAWPDTSSVEDAITSIVARGVLGEGGGE